MPAWSDENLLALCHTLRSPLFFAHVRAATGTAIARQNSHPFRYSRWMFMHNGQVGDWSLIRRRVEELIGCPVAMLSTSPERDDTILVKDPFED